MKISPNCVRAVIAAGVIALGVAPAAGARSAVPSPWNNCTQVHTKYAHGVGKLAARDRVRGSTSPVTTFKRSTRLYNSAMRYNSRLDGDKDGVACEKR
jgi:hypothetical protein